MSGDKLSTDESEVSEFIQNPGMNVKITKLDPTPEQLYNADETGLNWRQLRTKAFVTQQKHVSGRKLQKEQITLMVCANASGTHVLQWLVVEKSKSPPCIEKHYS
ncbi:hypothetical protein PR048_014227 [Dryococelus australis]|uniref:DDE-1 domain-containing protein n=1 Tax=Dryococelus australis TaxID=614101 RepID=A0ABQ9HDR3_9NEOP|nr:hypothetical protein PR048_014227 [Dryococelus australis]